MGVPILKIYELDNDVTSFVHDGEPTSGMIWFRSDTKELKIRQNGAVVKIVDQNGNVGPTPDVVSKTQSFNVLNTDRAVLLNGAITGTLPDAATATNVVFSFTKISAGGAATIAGSGGQTINGSSTYTLAGQYDSISIMSDGANWWRVGSFLAEAPAAGGDDILVSQNYGLDLQILIGEDNSVLITP